MKWVLTLICISLITSEIEHFFIHFGYSGFSSVNSLFISFDHFSVLSFIIPYWLGTALFIIFLLSKRLIKISKVQSCNPSRTYDLLLLLFSHQVVSDSLRVQRLQYCRFPCPSPSPRVYSNSCPLSRWCHPNISSSATPFSSCLQSFPASVSDLLAVWGMVCIQYEIGIWFSVFHKDSQSNAVNWLVCPYSRDGQHNSNPPTQNVHILITRTMTMLY